MLFIVWNERIELGIPILDEQHRGIVASINTLHYETRHNHGDAVIHPVLRALQEYTRLHFDLEERLMRMAGYPSLQDHLVRHQELVARLKAVGLGSDPYALLELLREWWLGHINDEDRKYAPWVAKLGPDEIG